MQNAPIPQKTRLQITMWDCVHPPSTPNVLCCNSHSNIHPSHDVKQHSELQRDQELSLAVLHSGTLKSNIYANGVQETLGKRQVKSSNVRVD